MRHNFRKLTIWKKSMELVVKVYAVTNELPENEKYGLRSQINRAAVSIPSNIAEGTSRRTDKEITRYLDIALGSTYELETQLLLVKRLFFDYEPNTDEVLKEVSETQKMIGGFKRKIQQNVHLPS